MTSTKPSLEIKFFGGAEPFIVTKFKTTNIDSLLRPMLELVSNMAGTIQVYYISGISEPITKKNMTVSVFLTELARKFKNLKPGDTDELWVYLEGNKNNTEKIR